MKAQARWTDDDETNEVMAVMKEIIEKIPALKGDNNNAG